MFCANFGFNCGGVRRFVFKLGVALVIGLTPWIGYTSTRKPMKLDLSG